MSNFDDLTKSMASLLSFWIVNLGKNRARKEVLSLVGSVKIMVDDLEYANAEVSVLFHSAIENSAKSL